MTKLHNIFILMVFGMVTSGFAEWLVPVNYPHRDRVNEVKLSAIGAFGLPRKARATVPAHLHTGVDILRPTGNYDQEPIHPAHAGRIISILDDGPYSYVVLEHQTAQGICWTLYEHFHVLVHTLGQQVNTNDTLGYYFNKRELNVHGWQFDHVHFEVMKVAPPVMKPTARAPLRAYGSYTITTYTKQDLDRRLENPLHFLQQHVQDTP